MGDRLCERKRMELKELCEKTIRIFEIKSIDELSDALFHVCKTGEYDKIHKFEKNDWRLIF